MMGTMDIYFGELFQYTTSHILLVDNLLYPMKQDSIANLCHFVIMIFIIISSWIIYFCPTCNCFIITFIIISI